MDAKLWTLDRIEDGDHAVLIEEGGDERIVPRSELPPGAGEGDVVREVDGEGGARYVVDPEATERLRQETEELRSRLRRGPSGPISL